MFPQKKPYMEAICQTFPTIQVPLKMKAAELH